MRPHRAGPASPEAIHLTSTVRPPGPEPQDSPVIHPWNRLHDELVDWVDSYVF